MDKTTLNNLLNLRMAVYQLGVEKGLWPNLGENAASEYLNIVFPKTSALSYYNLILNVAQSRHADKIPTEYYGLFKCPIQIEEEMTRFVKGELKDGIRFFEDPLLVLKDMCTVSCDPAIQPIYVGQSTESFDSIVHVMAFHYYNIFTAGSDSYPYFN